MVRPTRNTSKGKDEEQMDTPPSSAGRPKRKVKESNTPATNEGSTPKRPLRSKASLGKSPVVVLEKLDTSVGGRTPAKKTAETPKKAVGRPAKNTTATPKKAAGTPAKKSPDKPKAVAVTPAKKTPAKSKKAESPARRTRNSVKPTPVSEIDEDDEEEEDDEPEPSPAEAKKVGGRGVRGKGKAADSPAGKDGKVEWKFNVYGIPKCPLPCRETQFEEIWKFLFENVTEKNSGCMYVSGVPGTGKTVIVQAVVDTMQRVSEKEKKNPQFQYLYINGLTLASPDKIWKRMFKGLGLKSKTSSISTKEALKRLELHFESHQRNPVILVVDELDQILDKQQSILYQLLEWSSHAKNMFSLVAIFNTMSLPEHGLAMRNYSRMGFKRAVFPPYSYEQLHTIVSNMLSTFKTAKLSVESITLLSRKVAAVSGDARRALEIARRALEIAEAGNLSGILAVSNAFKEIFSSAKIETIKHTSLLEQLVLRTICDEVRCSGVEEVLTAKIYDNVLPKAVYDGFQWSKDEILKALLRLSIMHLVIVEDNFPSLHKRVMLKVPVEDVNFALGIHTDLET